MNRMDKDILYRFFEGKTSLEDEIQIKRWLDVSEINRITFMQERKKYDAILLNISDSQKSNQKEISIFWHRMATVAAVLFLLIVSTLYLRLLLQEEISQKYNTLVVPAGQHMHLTLADNTDIWLNANTSLRYPSEFSKKDRIVYLDGEAFFDVSKNNKKPFTVKTASGDIRVTGTSFNVEAYSKQGGFETNLFDGSVDIYQNEQRLISLKPNERSFLKEGKIYVTPITDRDKFLWKEGLIAFNNKTLEEILSSLEKYFDIKIQISSNSLPQYTYTGKFRQSDGVDYALRVLQKSIRFSYERDEETGIVYIR